MTYTVLPSGTARPVTMYTLVGVWGDDPTRHARSKCQELIADSQSMCEVSSTRTDLYRETDI